MNETLGATAQGRLRVEREGRLAEHLGALGTRGAGSAKADQGHHHMIADGDMGYAGADLLDHAGGLVAEDGGQAAAPGALEVEDVAVANRGGCQLDADFTRLRRGEVDVLDDQRLGEFTADGGFHGGLQRR